MQFLTTLFLARAGELGADLRRAWWVRHAGTPLVLAAMLLGSRVVGSTLALAAGVVALIAVWVYSELVGTAALVHSGRARLPGSGRFDLARPFREALWTPPAMGGIIAVQAPHRWGPVLVAIIAAVQAERLSTVWSPRYDIGASFSPAADVIGLDDEMRAWLTRAGVTAERFLVSRGPARHAGIARGHRYVFVPEPVVQLGDHRLLRAVIAGAAAHHILGDGARLVVARILLRVLGVCAAWAAAGPAGASSAAQAAIVAMTALWITSALEYVVLLWYLRRRVGACIEYAEALLGEPGGYGPALEHHARSLAIAPPASPLAHALWSSFPRRYSEPLRRAVTTAGDT